MWRTVVISCVMFAVHTVQAAAQGSGVQADAKRCLTVSEQNSDLVLPYCDRALKYQSQLSLDELVDVLITRGHIYYTKNDVDRAMADFNAAIDANPQDARGVGSRGLVFDKKNELDRALADYNEAIRLDPSDDAFVARGSVLGRKGDFDLALADFNSALRLNPSNSLAQKYRCMMLKQKGDRSPCRAR
jgi:tetratricopeptide (TPR) repeat protein